MRGISSSLNHGGIYRLDRLKGIEIPVASEVSLFHRMENVDIIELGFPFPQIFTRSSVSRSSHTWKLRVEVEGLQVWISRYIFQSEK